MSEGRFSGNPRTEWLAEAGVDRRMRLLEDFWFDDAAGRRWPAPRGSVVDGASIPEALWSTVGSPYTGAYRRASIVHDVACDTPGVRRDEADAMFHAACLAGGCTPAQAKLLYLGVRLGSWGAGFGLWAAGPLPTVAHPDGEPAREAQLLRAQYTLVADRLARTPDDFASVKAVVDEALQR